MVLIPGAWGAAPWRVTSKQYNSLTVGADILAVAVEKIPAAAWALAGESIFSQVDLRLGTGSVDLETHCGEHSGVPSEEVSIPQIGHLRTDRKAVADNSRRRPSMNG